MKLKIYSAVVTLAALVFGGLLFFPAEMPPLLDRGHRVYGVPDEAARAVVLGLLASHGLGEAFTFDVPPTHQTLLNDGRTVINVLDKTGGWQEYPSSGISLPVKNPAESANLAVQYLRSSRYEAYAKEIPLPKNQDSIWVVRCSAFEGWSLVFRRHALVLGKPVARK